MPEHLLVADHVRKCYSARRCFSRSTHVTALDDVSLSVARGETLALIGQSGSGKSTFARCVARMEDVTSGHICYDGRNISQLRRHQLVPVRRDIQLIFQDVATALNPRFCAAEIIEEPLLIRRWGTREHRRHRALELMEQLQLSASWANRKPHEFSGGQRQRLAIARALAVGAKVLIFDEALSGIDVCTQAQMLYLLAELQRSLELTYIYISHDLALLPHIADRIAVMANGRIVEVATASELYRTPLHPETRALLDCTARMPQSRVGVAV